MRAVVGLLGKTTKDGTPNPDPTSQLIKHLNRALKKPAADEQFIFIDLNTEGVVADGAHPSWLDRAASRVEEYERRRLAPDAQAYVFLTNFPFHRSLSAASAAAVVPFGLGIPDFNRPGVYRLSETYRQRQIHIDAFDVAESLSKYPRIPPTFDGSLPSETFHGSISRVAIGQTYFFEEMGIFGTVTAATVNEQEKCAAIAISTPDQKAYIVKQSMSDAELADYLEHGDAYFGRAGKQLKKNIDTPFELFEWFMQTQSSVPREKLLEWMSNWPDFEKYKTMNDEELLIEYCELMASSLQAKRAMTENKT